MGRGVELGRRRLQLGQGAGRDLGQAERRRRQEALRRDEDLTLGLGAVAQAHGGVGRDSELSHGPAVSRRGEALQRADDVVGDDGDDAVGEDGDVLQRLARAGREDDRRRAVRGDRRHADRRLQRCKRQGHQRAGLVVDAAQGPVLFRREDQTPGHDAFDGDAFRQGQLVRLAVGAERPDLRAEGVQRAAEQHGLDRAGLVAEDHGRDAIAAVGLLAAIDLGGVGQRVAALEGFDDEGIARLRHRAGTEVGGDQQGVAVQPGQAMLALGDDEAALSGRHEGLGRQVELAHDHGVLAAVRQVDQAAGLVRRQAVGALEHPVTALGLGQGVDVQQGLPLGLGGAIAGQGRAAPDPLRVGRVLPEVAKALAEEADAGDAVGGRQNGLGLLAEGFVAAVAGQSRQRLFVFGSDEGLGLGPVHLFQRQMIVGGLDPLGRQVAREVRRGHGRGDGGRVGGRMGQDPLSQGRTSGEDQHRQGGGQEQGLHDFLRSSPRKRGPRALAEPAAVRIFAHIPGLSPWLKPGSPLPRG
ncbi:hypothetical protein D3C85_935070 [compost metagenome]